MVKNHLRQHLSFVKLSRDVLLFESAASYRHFARHLCLSQSVVARMWNHFQTQGNAIYRHEEGRQRATSNTDGLFVAL